MKRSSVNRTLHYYRELSAVSKRAWLFAHVLPIRVAMRLSWAISRLLAQPYRERDLRACRV